jgi:hypothetical protein
MYRCEVASSGTMFTLNLSFCFKVIGGGGGTGTQMDA